MILENLAPAQRLSLEKLQDPMWRLCSGEIYKILVKTDTDDEGYMMPFIPNDAQRQFLREIWHRNIILKARQLGFTTLISIMWLDFAAFNANTKCGMIAQDDGTAQNIFRDKIKFAYDNMPEELKELMPLAVCNLHEMQFRHNNSSLRCAVSLRSGTYQRLHISEFGKICAKAPAKAEEVVTGSIPTVPSTGVLVIESTAEGQQGAFHDMTMAAIKKKEIKKALTAKDYRFHFYAWWTDKAYRMPDVGAVTDKDHKYFQTVETDMNTTLDIEQRSWYVATRTEFEDAGKGEKMLQEYPSTPKEAFQKSVEGTFYALEMSNMRKQGRICKIPVLDVPVNTFWDIGNAAGTAIWLHQKVGLEHRMIKFHEETNKPYSYFVKYLQDTGYIFNKHFLPHDAGHERQGQEANKTVVQMLEDLGLKNIVVVGVVSTLDVGIQLTKQAMAGLYIDSVECEAGIKRLDGYKRKWDNVQGTWRPEPEKHDGNSEAADALRQFAQALDAGLITISTYTQQRKKASSDSWKTA